MDDFNSARPGDWVIYCDICGLKCWAQSSIELDKYTGRGGCRVCPDCADPIDYGLVPYKIRPEKPVPFVRGSGYTADNVPQTYPPFNTATMDPMSVRPADLLQMNLKWEELAINWEDWNIAWDADFSGDGAE